MVKGYIHTVVFKQKRFSQHLPRNSFHSIHKHTQDSMIEVFSGQHAEKHGVERENGCHDVGNAVGEDVLPQ